MSDLDYQNYLNENQSIYINLTCEEIYMILDEQDKLDILTFVFIIYIYGKGYHQKNEKLID